MIYEHSEAFGRVHMMESLYASRSIKCFSQKENLLPCPIDCGRYDCLRPSLIPNSSLNVKTVSHPLMWICPAAATSS